MSKAFVRESDASESDEPVRRQASLPPGAVNYMTPEGAVRLEEEFRRLRDTERPAAALAAARGDPESRTRLQAVDLRLRDLEGSLRSLQVVAPRTDPHDIVRFGSVVTVRDAAGEETTFRIVGAEEAEPDRNRISWVSPAGRALLNGRVGQKVTVRRPRGDVVWEIRRIAGA
jgi:transcription elongation factor GreB